MSTYQISETVSLKTIRCGTCGVFHAIPTEKYDSSLKEGGFWYCPNGHQRGFSQGGLVKDLEKEKRRRERAESNTKFAQEETARLLRSLRAQKAANTRLKNLAEAGACPC